MCDDGCEGQYSAQKDYTFVTGVVGETKGQMPQLDVGVLIGSGSSANRKWILEYGPSISIIEPSHAP